MKVLAQKLKKLDRFEQVPQELREGSLLTSIMSVVTLVMMVYLSLTSTFNFLVKRDQSSEFHLHQAQKNELLQVNLEIKLFRMPCEIVSLDVMDKMGKHQLHVGAQLYVQPLDSYGITIGDKQKVKDIDPHTWDNGKSVHFNSLLRKLQQKEGCVLSGSLQIRKVPGNFHISAHAFPLVLRKMYAQGLTLDLSHQITQLYFGTPQQKDKAYQQFYYPNVDYLKRFHDSTSGYVMEDPSLFHEYYLKIVPSYFIQDEQFIHYNQYTANHQSYHTDDLPAIFFKYELSPVEMSNHITKERMYQYIVDLCAIIGGVYYIAKFIDALLHSGIKTIRAKTRLGKQN